MRMRVLEDSSSRVEPSLGEQTGLQSRFQDLQLHAHCHGGNNEKKKMVRDNIIKWRQMLQILQKGKPIRRPQINVVSV